LNRYTSDEFFFQPIGQSPSPVSSPRNEAYNMRIQGMHTNADGNIARSNQNAAAALKAMLTTGEVRELNRSCLQ